MNSDYQAIRRRRKRYLFIARAAAVLLALISGTGCRENRPGEPFKPPEVVPYFDARPSPVDGEGTAAPELFGPFPVGERADFEIEFTIGESGIAPGGYILLQVSPWWGWSPPHPGDETIPGAVRVRADFAEPPLAMEVLSLNRILVFFPGGTAPAGGRITFSYLNAAVDRFAEEEELFQFFTDVDGDGHPAPIGRQPRIRTAARRAARLRVTVPSRVRPGKEIEIRAAPLDRLGNWSRLEEGDYRLQVETEGGPGTESGQPIRADGGEPIISFSWTPPDRKSVV